MRSPGQLAKAIQGRVADRIASVRHVTMVGGRQVADVSGVLLPMDDAQMSPRTLNAIRRGRYEQEEGRQVARLVEPGERIVELGGGIGYLGALASKTGRAESIAVYEANPDLIPLIEITKQLNDVDFDVYNDVVLPLPTSDQVPFYIRRHFWASSLAPEPYGFVRHVDIPTVSWSDMMEKHRPTMLIVDIEGGEAELFQGISLAGVTKVLTELHQDVIGRKGMRRVFDFFSDQGFHYDQDHSQGAVVLFSHVERVVGSLPSPSF